MSRSMNCNNVQQRLLASTDPARVPASVQPHLTECAACRDWHARLVRIEHAVPLVPVAAPRPSAKADLIRRFETLGRVRGPSRRPVLGMGWPTWAAGLA